MQTLFDGPALLPQDHVRLSGQLEKVKALMADEQWRTLKEIAVAVHGSEAGVSARLRDLRKAPLNMIVERQRLNDRGLWIYRVLGAAAHA